MTTANKLTLSRVAMIPLFIVLMLISFPSHRVISLIVFALASATDCVDGYVARKYNQVTTFGKFMDPLADKLLVTAAILIFVQWGQMPSWAAIIIIAREFAVTGLRLIAVGEGIVIAAGFSGKVKTVASIFAILFMLTPWHGFELIGMITVDAVCVAVMVVTTVWSGVEYFVKNKNLMNAK
ncbi:MAG: CDP-diacylglycerol--glycerol-3-phosphate 3-phosphatidyltransferase [Clostridiales bacterium]|nr:CDP-diacylglycerol--glycerol-3-phosphate 3-phosphatidyltransferase [Clostridiales bacterium]